MNKKQILAGGIIAAAITIMLPAYATDKPSGSVKGSTTFLYLAQAEDTTQTVDGDNLPEDEDEAAADTIAADTTGEDGAGLLPWPQNVVRRIENVFSGTTIFNTSMVGMKIYDLTADSVIYEHNARQLMRPASTMKMIVAVTALDRLTAKHTFKTLITHDGKTDSLGNLRGDIYCKGGFDPTLGNDDIDEMADSIIAAGIDTIRGNICLDLSMKDGDRLGEGWCWDDDNPILSPLLVNKKDDFGNRLLWRLREKGIVVKGYCKECRMPADADTLFIKETALPRVLRRMMKRSDNLYAESVFYQLAADVSKRPEATARNGRQAVNSLISRLGLRPSTYYIADGSGLSLYNYVSPELEVEFLKYAYRHSGIYNELLPVMPIAGTDGTLEKRMRRGAAHGNVKAKTGTVTGVSALAGYCTAANGHLLCFSIINMGIRHASSGRNFQDKICQALCK